MEEVFWKQKSRNSWIEEGDKNTSFFHTSANEKIRRSSIQSIILEDGTVITDHGEIKAVAVSFFQELFQAEEVSSTSKFIQNILQWLDQQDNDALLIPPSMDEVFATIQSIPTDEATGPNRFLASFFASSWKIVRVDIHKAKVALISGVPLPREQGAFVQGRYIAENITLTQEAMREIDRKARGGNLILKLDLEKAYDKILEACWGNNWFSILINNEATGFFKSSRGLHQSDPLSPTLFIIAMEAFSINLQKLIRPSHRAMKNFLHIFQAATGQKINSSKSSYIGPSKWTSSRNRNTERLLGFGRARDGMQYLGAPLTRGRIRTASFQFLLDKVSKRISGWVAMHISQASRATLICHVLGSYPIHIMAALHIPGQVIQRLESNFADFFFWGWAEGKKKFHWLTWKKVARPKEEGGLGIRNLREVLNALRMKLAWAVKYGNNQGPWVKLMRAKHERELQDVIPATVQRNSSLIWKKIREFLPTVQEHTPWTVEHGDANIWKYN
ncbi:uncharacterized protein LOC131248235 [Magnolia sinica]|uniref:uncharacterized protein LOC131248235 n=1 Tax=Magnolia sinica TaxID=86752 RepID=UPI0026593DE8|nr:uncharacterized protein LOC131248235 [Magnolia sinica]